MHNRVADTTSSGHTRLTCTACNNATLVRQPYMTGARWAEAEKAFLAEHSVPDETEGFRRVLVAEINAAPGERAALEAEYGQVWDTDQLRADFDVLSFMAPFVYVRRKADGVKGTLLFQHMPRFYFDFNPS
jgi:hypothetical protein